MAEEDARVEVQIASKDPEIPAVDKIIEIVKKLLELTEKKEKTLSVRVVEDDEIRALNLRFRGLDKPTNVLSFPSTIPVGIQPDYLGDIVVCADVVRREALEQGISAEAHWAHMLTHGLLHLQGYDHERSDEAERMEALESKLLAVLGFADPYAA